MAKTTEEIEEIKEYICELNDKYKAGITTEHTFRGTLETLLKNLTDCEVINEAKRIECGAPDLTLLRKNVPIVYVEAKDIGKNLDSKENKEQFDRYKKALDHLIITDYLVFWFYEYGELVENIRIAESRFDGIFPVSEQFTKFESALKNFCNARPQKIESSSKLAEIMANKARLMSDVVEKTLSKGDNDVLTGQMAAFKKVLIYNITSKEFADLYAQTIAYGMFAARLNGGKSDTFSREEAAKSIPKSNPFLRQLFQNIAGYDLDSRLAWIVDNLAEMFRAADMRTIMKNFGERTKKAEPNLNLLGEAERERVRHTDPVLHFYEDFLSSYDPALRKSRGVWYTPQSVVNFIVRAVDEILQNEFKLSQGLADTAKVKIKIEEKEMEVHRVQILDPAAGTGTFLVETAQKIYEKFGGQSGIWQSYVEQHLIPRLNGFELLVVSHTIAHINLEYLLERTGYKPTDDKRLNIYLTNSLEEQHPDAETFFAQFLANEANEASRIKRDTPVMVVLGNPPYSGESQNKGEWIELLMKDYKKEPNTETPLQERNPKWLNDDYVKFIRLGQYFIEKNGEGILAFINNNSFIDNLTFRGMRSNLLNSFDKIYIINLHGNSKKKEACPDGSKDENVFDIMQGVSINIFVKTGRKKENTLAEVYHFDIFGKREKKYDFLLNNSLKTIKLKKLKPVAPYYFFVPKDFSSQKEYKKGFKINELFPVNSVGITTGKDIIFINIEPKTLLKNVKDHLNINPDENLVQSITYRPFDKQHIYYDTKKIERARENVIQHFIKGENLGLLTSRIIPQNQNFDRVFITKNIADLHSASDGTYVFPLYLYKEGGVEKGKRLPDKKTPNLNEEIVKRFQEILKLNVSPEEIFDYIYAVLHSTKYRERYKEFLKIDFPRVPFPENAKQFGELTKLGEKLRKLHLLEGVEPLSNMANFPIAGTGKIEKIRFYEKSETYPKSRVYINEEQYFENVPTDAWNFYIGGYQPAQKWLKDRKGRKLEYDDIIHFQKIIRVLKETGEIMLEVDSVLQNL